MVDWSIKPPVIQGVSAEEAAKNAEYIKDTYDTENNHRPVLGLERSPFYPELILSIHDFYFAIWNIEMEDQKEPIFRSANSQGSYNTCGAFSPTRPGVIFIAKTNGIDVWDFVD